MDSLASIPSTPSATTRTRLFVGEGNFSFTAALIHKHKENHPALAASIIATEIITVDEYQRSLGNFVPIENDGEFDFISEGEATLQRIKRLEQLGVKFILGLDATQLHQNEFILSKKPIPRIHWNLPLNDQSEGSFEETLGGFFKSCSQIQEVAHRVHITLIQGQNKTQPNSKDFAPSWIFQQGYKASIVLISSVNGYKLISKRKFLDKTTERYPGYVTRNSFSGNVLKSNQLECIREFVFEKLSVIPSFDNIKNINEYVEKFQGIVDPQKIKVSWWTVKTKNDQKAKPVFYYECETDEDSSSYSSSESDA